MVALGIACAVGASLLYNVSIALQALEVRDTSQDLSLRVSLLGRLLRNRRWLGVTRLGERPGVREHGAVAAIVLGVAGIAWAAPERTTDHAGTAAIAIALALVAIPILLPYALRAWHRSSGTIAVVSAGFGYAWTAISSKLFTDEVSAAAGSILVALAWLASAAVSEGLALLSEMCALQRRAATRVAPAMFAVQVTVPVILAPLIFEERWSTTPLDGGALIFFVLVALAGVVLLAGSRAVGAVLESAHSED
jgi:hypothetical protein